MRIDVVSLFPAMFAAVCDHGITARALERGLWSLGCWNPRDYTHDAYRRVDDRPYGGGPGMVMLAEPLAAAIEAASAAAMAATNARTSGTTRPPHRIYLSAQGRPLTHDRVVELAALPSLVLVAGRYEAIDQRVIDTRIDEEICIGDFVVSGGELPAMMLIDAIVRMLPGALNDDESVLRDSFADGLLDCPHYTRPEVFESMPVPGVLMSGHHSRIARWRRERSLELTAARRPDLLERARAAGRLDAEDERWLADHARCEPAHTRSRRTGDETAGKAGEKAGEGADGEPESAAGGGPANVDDNDGAGAL